MCEMNGYFLYFYLIFQYPPAADGLQKLTGLPLNWFLQLFVTARDKAVRPAVLASLAQMYIDKAMENVKVIVWYAWYGH